jgi:hypothetical protein
MLRTDIIDPIMDKRWDTFVMEHPNGLLGHTAAWKIILEKSFKHIKAYYLALIDTKTDSIRAALPICQVKSIIGGNRLISLPFATLCEPLVRTSEELNILIDAAFDLKERLGCKYIEIKGTHGDGIIADERLTKTSNYYMHYLRITTKPEELLIKFKRQARQSIRQASERVLEIKESEDESDLKLFYRFYQDTRKRNLLPSQPYNFFSLMWDEFRPSGCIDLLLAFHRNKPIGGAILFKYKNRASLEFLATTNNSTHLRPNHLLVWHAMKKSHEEGFHLFDFGRTACDNKGLIRFKETWGTSKIPLFDYIGPNFKVNGTDNSHLLKRKLVNSLVRLAPQKAYSAISNFIYSQTG